MDKDFYSIKEFASKLSISSITVRRAIKNARINAFRVGSSEKSSWRIPHSEIARIALLDFNKMVDQRIEEKLKERK